MALLNTITKLLDSTKATKLVEQLAEYFSRKNCLTRVSFLLRWRCKLLECYLIRQLITFKSLNTERSIYQELTIHASLSYFTVTFQQAEEMWLDQRKYDETDIQEEEETRQERRFSLFCLTLEYGTKRLCQNVGN